jgi:predicted nuclease of predicted toxin-antitoxin system
MNFLIDYNLRGQAALLWGSIAAEGWLELIPIRFVEFEEVGLLENSSDRLVWQVAQSNQIIILTANRNMKGLTSRIIANDVLVG